MLYSHPESESQPTSRKRGVAMITEFFYPRCGGVEIHVLSISKALIQYGYHVIIITRYDENHHGCELYDDILPVYYLPLENMSLGVIFPYFFIWAPTLRSILQNEEIDIVHYHQCTSVMFHTSIRQCELMGIHTVYTDHSLLQLDELGGILINKVMKAYSCNCNAFICVSHADCLNFLRRQNYQTKPENVYIIPNAVDSERFSSDFSDDPFVMNIHNQFIQTNIRNEKTITIVVLSRLVYRKGVFLLEQVIDRVLSEFPNVNFLIGGSGNKEEIIKSQANKWNDRCQRLRVNILGEIDHSNVPAFFSYGDIFLSCSLTESFNITLLEAFVSGCRIASTNVGGVPELLPMQYGHFVPPTVDHLIEAIRSCIWECQKSEVHHPIQRTEEIDNILKVYDWNSVCIRLMCVYDRVLKQPRTTWSIRMKRLWKEGFGSFLILMVEWILLVFLNVILDIFSVRPIIL